MLLLQKGAHVDIHLKSGLMVRGIITFVNSESITIGHKPSIYSVSGHGSEVFIEVEVASSEICVCAIRNEPD